jgi:hypothetical protein
MRDDLAKEISDNLARRWLVDEHEGIDMEIQKALEIPDAEVHKAAGSTGYWGQVDFTYIRNNPYSLAGVGVLLACAAYSFYIMGSSEPTDKED